MKSDEEGNVDIKELFGHDGDKIKTFGRENPEESLSKVADEMIEDLKRSGKFDEELDTWMRQFADAGNILREQGVEFYFALGSPKEDGIRVLTGGSKHFFFSIAEALFMGSGKLTQEIHVHLARMGLFMVNLNEQGVPQDPFEIQDDPLNHGVDTHQSQKDPKPWYEMLLRWLDRHLLIHLEG